MNINHQRAHMLQRPPASAEQPKTYICEYQSLSYFSVLLYIADIMIQRIVFLFLPVIRLWVLSATSHLPEFNESQKAKSKNHLVKLERCLNSSVLKNCVLNYFLFNRVS